MKSGNFILHYILIFSIFYFFTIPLSAEETDSNAPENTENPPAVQSENRQEKESTQTDREIDKINRETKEISKSVKPVKPAVNTFSASLSAGTEYMMGHTTYQIGGFVNTPTGSGFVHFPISELMFPLNTLLAFVELNIKYPDVQYLKRTKSKFNFKTNIINKTNNMEDRDWGVPYEYPPNSDNWEPSPYGNDHLDIYSESDTDLRAYFLDIDLLYRVFRIIDTDRPAFEINFFLGLGYIYQSYSYECRLIQQWDYRYDMPPDAVRQDYIGDGSVGITYDVSTHIPYLKINGEAKLHKRNITELSLGITPFAMHEDEDDHILRSKVSKAECDGWAIIVSALSRVDILESFFIRLHAEFVYIYTEGRENQYDYQYGYNVWIGELDHNAFSMRYSGGLSAGYRF